MGEPQFQVGARAQYAAELRILLVYLSESLGRLDQNMGATGGHFSSGGGPLAHRRTAPEGVCRNWKSKEKENNAFCCRKDASFGARHKNLNEDRPTLSATKT